MVPEGSAASEEEEHHDNLAAGEMQLVHSHGLMKTSQL